MNIKNNEQSGSKCFLCKKLVEDGKADQDDKSSDVKLGEKLNTYYLIGKVRSGKKTEGGIVIACEPCWIDYAGFTLEDTYDIKLKHLERP